MAQNLESVVKYVEDRFVKSGIVIPNEQLFFDKFSQSGIQNREALIRKYFVVVLTKYAGNNFEITDIENLLSEIFVDPPTITPEEKVLISDYFVIFSRHLIFFLSKVLEEKAEDHQQLYGSLLSKTEDLEIDSTLVFGENIIPKSVKEFYKNKFLKAQPPDISLKHFIWKSSDRKLKKLWLLMDGLLIDCAFIKFACLFENSTQKVNWISKPANKREVAYFFHSLCREGYISKLQSRDINRIISKRITISGKSIDLGVLKRTYSRFKNSAIKKPSHQIEVINELITSLNESRL